MNPHKYQQLLNTNKEELKKLKVAELIAHQILTAAFIELSTSGHKYATLYINLKVEKKQMAYDLLNIMHELHLLKINTIAVQFNTHFYVKFQYKKHIDRKPPKSDRDEIKKQEEDLMAIQLTKDEFMCFLTLILYDDHYIAMDDYKHESYLYEHFKQNYRKGIYDTISYQQK